MRSALAEQGQALLVVSGGRSPVAFLEALSEEPLDWSRITLSLADERWVPESHADSNAGLVRRHLLRGEAAKARFIGLYQPAASLEEAAELADHHLHELPLPIDVLVLAWATTAIPPRCSRTALAWTWRWIPRARAVACRCGRRACRTSA